MPTLERRRRELSNRKFRALRKLPLICFAWVAQSSAALAAPAQFTIDFPLSNTVGPLRAGQLCFPKGAAKGTDFVSDQGQFSLLVRDILDAHQASAMHTSRSEGAPQIELHFTALAVKLCAKSWGAFGFGDTKTLTGKADFIFSWKPVGSIARTQPIAISLQLAGKDRMTAPLIMRRAVDRALQRIQQDMAVSRK